MKRNSDNYLERQSRIAKRRLESHLREKTHKQRTIRPEPLASILNREIFYLSESCSFSEESIDECMENLADLRRKVESGKRILLDFSKTKKLLATYGVYFYAEIQTVIEKYGAGCIYINLQSLPKYLRFVLKESGILTLTNRSYFAAGKKGFLPIIVGTKDDEIDVIIDYIIKIAEHTGELNLKPSEKAQAELLTSRAITEAMLNVDYHAYPDEQEAKYWWFTAVIIDGHLYISICDRGVGIHATLPYADWWENVMGLLAINDDAQMIQAAMAYTRTSHKHKKGRGLGTKDMQNLVLERKEGFMTIVSGRGHYTLDANKNGLERLYKTKLPITGTAINWKIPLRQKK